VIYTESGAGVETNKKMNGGANAKAADGRKLFKLENDTETFAHETVSSSLKKQIQSARLAKKMTQAQLAQAINEKPQIINEYECGKAIPNPQVCTNTRAPLPPQAMKLSLAPRAPSFFADPQQDVPCAGGKAEEVWMSAGGKAEEVWIRNVHRVIVSAPVRVHIQHGAL
jgi:DNA-binding XRE family transcriptional regulator